MNRRCIICFLYFLVFVNSNTFSQSFECDQSVYALGSESNSLFKISINPQNVSLLYEELIDDLGVELESLAFRSSDQKLYAISTVDKALYQIDADLNVNYITDLALNENFSYDAGEIDKTGNNYYVIKSSGNNSESLIRINLSNYAIQEFPLLSGFHFLDITLSPHDNLIYGYDQNDRRIIRFDLSLNDYFGLGQIKFEDDYQFIFTDDFGELWGLGTTANGVASGMFNINSDDGFYGTWVTGPENYMKDGASCPYGVSMIQKAKPIITIPCTEIEYTLLIGNGGTTISNLELVCDLPNGFEHVSTDYNPYFSLDFSNIDFVLGNLSLSSGVDSIVFTVEAGDIPGGVYMMQSVLGNSSGSFMTVYSDNDNTRRPQDSTIITVNRIEEDSIFENRFLCQGETIILDASEYSGTGIWNNGILNPELEIGEGGQYRFQAFSSCQSFVVIYDVVEATCPFTISIDHRIIPRETLACSELIFEYAFENSSGVTQYDLNFYDTLSAGFEILEVVEMPWLDKVRVGDLPNILSIEDFNLAPGNDTVLLRVYVDDIAPGNYPNRSILEGFPIEIGPFRESDDPETPELDSTNLIILGTISDSSQVELPLCSGETLELNGRPFGVDFLWPNGSTDSIYLVDEIGIYELQVFNGCEISYVFFNVIQGLDISVQDDFYHTIRLGDSIWLAPIINNLGSNLSFSWQDSQDTTMSCDTCLMSFVRPLRDNVYQLNVANEECSDSVFYNITVDNDRRVYVPNVFSPNRDGNNDVFYIQTPDFAVIQSFEIYDRWGNRIFYATDIKANDSGEGWRGQFKDFYAIPGVYVWKAEIYFLDQVTEVFSGDIAILP